MLGLREKTPNRGARRDRVAGGPALIWVSLWLALFVVSAGMCAGCGGERIRIAIAYVEKTPITRDQLEEWMRRLAPEHFVPDPPRYASCIAHDEALGELPVGQAIVKECQAQYTAVKDEALRFLISSAWLIGDVKAKGFAPSAEEVTGWLNGKEPLGGASKASRRLVVERELAEERIERWLRSREAGISRTQVARYYGRHIGRFERRERRYFDIIEHLADASAGRRIMSEIASGHRRTETPIHEVLDRPRTGEVVLATKRPIYKAIFAARSRAYVGPVRLNGGYAIFKVTRIIARRVAPLARMRGAIERQLAKIAHHQAVASFLRKWATRWRAKTSCTAGYVIANCRQYAGVQRLEPALTDLR
jgi:hypothetical protein